MYRLCAFITLLCLFTPVSANELFPVKMCVWDPIGKSGPAAQIMKDWDIFALKQGVKISFEIYSEELVAIEEFKLGRCDMVNMLGFRARNFNSFTGSIDAIGALSTYEQMAVVIKSMVSPKAEGYMLVGDFEVISIGPAGAIFGFTRDRNIILPEDFAGKKMAVLEGIPETEYLSKKYGITPVNSTVFNAFLKFNNGSVDLTAGPAIIYEPFEMYKGIEPNGGIYKKPFMFITMQVVARHSRIPDGFGRAAREFSLGYYPQMIKFLTDPEKRIPEHVWIDIPQHLIDHWIESFRQSRMTLGEMAIYDPRTLKLMQKVRCNSDPNMAECSAEKRE
jgi:hypothetical protein